MSNGTNGGPMGRSPVIELPIGGFERLDVDSPTDPTRHGRIVRRLDGARPRRACEHERQLSRTHVTTPGLERNTAVRTATRPLGALRRHRHRRTRGRRSSWSRRPSSTSSSGAQGWRSGDRDNGRSQRPGAAVAGGRTAVRRHRGPHTDAPNQHRGRVLATRGAGSACWLAEVRAVTRMLPPFPASSQPTFALPADFLCTADGHVLTCNHGSHADHQRSVDELLQRASGHLSATDRQRTNDDG